MSHVFNPRPFAGSATANVKDNGSLKSTLYRPEEVLTWDHGLPVGWTGMAGRGRGHAPGLAGQGPRPSREARLEPIRVEQHEDPSEGVVRGDAVRQGQEGLQPRLLAAAVG